MRALARHLSSTLPRASFDGLELVVGDARLAQDADRFFERAIEALSYAKSQAPTAYAQLGKDVRTIVLRPETTTAPYNRFQLGVVVPPEIALEADTPTTAAWLLYASGLSRGTDEAVARASEILRGLDPDRREAVRAVLPGGADQ
jgi:hypothetical protein